MTASADIFSNSLFKTLSNTLRGQHASTSHLCDGVFSDFPKFVCVCVCACFNRCGLSSPPFL